MKDPTVRITTRIRVRSDLLSQARLIGVDLSRAAEQGIADAVSRRTTEIWLAQNRGALQSSNAFVEAHGVPLAEYRKF